MSMNHTLHDKKNIPINHDFLNQYIEGKKQYIEVDFSYYSKIIYSIYQSKNYEKVRYLSFCIEKYIPISISTIICPMFDKFYTDNCEIQPFFSLNVIPYREKCFVFLSWLNEYDNHMQWIKKKFSSDLNKLINYLCFMESEDYFVSPTFYSTVIVKEKSYLTKALYNRSFDPGLGFNQTKEIYKFT
jgi:hypothetical protein